MHGIRKALKASDRRRTRFHTERGQVMPISAWLRLPQSIHARLCGADADGPWMVPAAVDRLHAAIQPTWRVLEFGSGASTAWYAARAEYVVSLEDDPEWFENVRDRLGELVPDKCELRRVPLEAFPLVALEFAPATFDLVVIDGNQGHGVTRADCALAALPLIKPGGLVVVDDSDVHEFQPILDIFRGWESERFVGVKSRPLMAVETSILRRPKTQAFSQKP